MRQLWLDSVTNYRQAYPDDPYPLYLTLSGAEGRDIQLLIENGLLEVTEAGNIPFGAKHQVIAVESNISAVIALNRRFPGLKIFEQPFQNLLRSTSATRWPDGDDEKFCRARVINLDLNQPLTTDSNPSELRFPVLLWVQKLCQLHAEHRIDWSLCLTLHGEILWEAATSLAVQSFLKENFGREPQFREACRRTLGDDLFGSLAADTACNFAELARTEQQAILMAFVPKKIAQMVHHQGWLVQTARNLRYGGSAGTAPMVSWIIDFVFDSRALQTPDTVYREALTHVLAGAGAIAEDGVIH